MHNEVPNHNVMANSIAYKNILYTKTYLKTWGAGIIRRCVSRTTNYFWPPSLREAHYVRPASAGGYATHT